MSRKPLDYVPRRRFGDEEDPDENYALGRDYLGESDPEDDEEQEGQPEAELDEEAQEELPDEEDDDDEVSDETPDDEEKEGGEPDKKEERLVVQASALSRQLTQPQADYTTAWMVTFTDLVALMLTFFVLLYSMSVMERLKWEALVESLSSTLKVERVVQDPLPSKTLTLDPVDFVPGEDLDYLSTLLAGKMEDDPFLSQSVITRLSDRLVISLPGDLLFEPGQVAPQDKAEGAIGRLGEMLRYVDNKIEIAGHADPSPTNGGGVYSSNWQLSLARAQYVAHLLDQAGYTGTILSRGYGDSRYSEISANLSNDLKNKLARRVDIVVHLYAGENG